MKFLERVRTPERKSVQKQLLLCIGVLALGVLLGVFQKYLDISQAELPPFLMKIDELLDLGNFLGSFSPWMIAAVCIAVYSCSPIWAGIKVFCFFAGMTTSYYLYSYYVGGFFPKSYAMIWAVLTMISPFLAFLCWYAKGKGWFSLLISAGILGFMLNTAFAYGFWYLDIRSGLDILMLLLGILILYQNPKKWFSSLHLLFHLQFL